jgi:hypothetical protein
MGWGWTNDEDLSTIPVSLRLRSAACCSATTDTELKGPDCHRFNITPPDLNNTLLHLCTSFA